MRRCANCKFFQRESPSAGECRRHAPVVRMALVRCGLEPPTGEFPRVPPDGWCGEFVPRMRLQDRPDEEASITCETEGQNG